MNTIEKLYINRDKIRNMSKYHYNHPDYSKGLKPIDPPLDILEHGDELFNYFCAMEDDSYDAIFGRMKKLSHKKQVSQVNNLLMTYLSRWHSGKEEDDELEMYPVRVGTALIEGCHLRECLPTLLEMLKQEEYFQRYFFSNDNLEMMLPGVLYQIIEKEDLPVLLEFMETPGLLFSSKKFVAMAVGTLPRKDPSALTQVQGWMEDVINCYMPIGKDSDMFDEELLETIKTADKRTLTEDEESGEFLFRNYQAMSLCEEDDDDWDDDDEDDSSGHSSWYEDFNLDEYDWQEYKPYAKCDKAEYLAVEKSAIRKLTIHVNLMGTEPEVYRDIEVPSNLKLTSLAGVILVAMGWDEDHLHQFVKLGKKQQFYATSLQEIDRMMDGSLDGSEYCIGDLLTRVGSKIAFEYDYGDSWIHSLTLTAREKPNGELKVKLLDGKRACPPDDCGGIPGYMYLCEVMKDMTSEDAMERIEWLGSKYDPEFFPLESAKSKVDRFNKSRVPGW